MINYYNEEFYGPDPFVLMDQAREFALTGYRNDGIIRAVYTSVTEDEQFGYRCVVTVVSVPGD